MRLRVGENDGRGVIARAETGLASARCVKFDIASDMETEVVRVRPSTLEMLKRELWRCVGTWLVEAVAVSTVVVAVGSDGGAGAWNETR